MLQEIFNPKLYNINFFYADSWFGLSNVLICGSLLIIVVVAWRFFAHRRLDKTRLFSLLLLFMLPTVLAFVYQHFKLVNYEFINRDYDQTLKLDSFVCRMDQAQKMNGFFCGFPKFLAIAEEQLPANAKVQFYAPGIMMPFFNYYALNNFRLAKDHTEADYILFYFYDRSIELDKANNLIIREPGGSSSNLGKWQALKSINPAIFILKKL